MGVALVQAARAAVKQKDSYFAAQYRRIVIRRGDRKAIVAVAHSLLVVIYHMLNGTTYADQGADLFAKRTAEATKRRSIKDLERLGYMVTLQPAEAA